MPQTLFDILKLAELTRDEALVLDEKGVIRIEKKLKAYQKLHTTLNLQKVETTIEALKNHLPQIKYCYTDELLYHLFHRKKFKENEFLGFQYLKDAELNPLRLFFATYLEEDLLIEFKDLFEHKAYKQLNRWLEASSLFSLNFRQNYHSFLFQKLQLVLEILEQKPSSFQLNVKIPFAKKNFFYKALGLEKNPDTYQLLFEIMAFYERNHHYTIGRDFTSCILAAMQHYDTQDRGLLGTLLGTNMAHGGSNKVAVIAGVSILSFVALLFFVLFKAIMPPSKPHKPPVQYQFPEYRQQVDIMFKMHYLFRRGESITTKDTNCDSTVIKRLDPFLKYKIGQKGLDFKYKVINANDFKTGDNYHKPQDLYTSINKTDKNMQVFNNTRQPMFVYVYVSVCYYDEWKAYYPCQYPFASNKVYVEPGDTLAFDYRFDSLFIQTAQSLYRLEETIEGNKLQDFNFCPITKTDSMLYSTAFINKSITGAIGGVLSISKPNNAYQISWSGKANAIYNAANKTFLEPNKTCLLKEKGWPKFKKTINKPYY